MRVRRFCSVESAGATDVVLLDVFRLSHQGAPSSTACNTSPVGWCIRAGGAAVVAALAVAVGALGCQKSLRGARCDCVVGWKCCKPAADLCVRVDESCPGMEPGGTTGMGMLGGDPGPPASGGAGGEAGGAAGGGGAPWSGSAGREGPAGQAGTTPGSGGVGGLRGGGGAGNQGSGLGGEGGGAKRDGEHRGDGGGDKRQQTAIGVEISDLPYWACFRVALNWRSETRSSQPEKLCHFQEHQYHQKKS